MFRRLTAALGAIALAALTLAGPAQAGPPAAVGSADHRSAQPEHSRGPSNAMGWYLQLGDSLAAGYQPDRGSDPTGGYADDVLGALRADAGKTRLRNLACPGETVVTMVDGGRCDYAKGSQLDQALHFLHAHGPRTRAITVTIGANDVVGCVLSGSLDPVCLAEGMSDVATLLPEALGALREAAPEAEIVVLNYYNPILAFWLQGEQGQQLAEASVELQEQLNAQIAAAAAGAGAEVADVAAAFDSTDTSTVEHPEYGALPTNVARICADTWMCARGDIHADTGGYDVLGQAVADVLEPTPRSRCGRS